MLLGLSSVEGKPARKGRIDVGCSLLRMFWVDHWASLGYLGEAHSGLLRL